MEKRRGVPCDRGKGLKVHFGVRSVPGGVISVGIRTLGVHDGRREAAAGADADAWKNSWVRFRQSFQGMRPGEK